MCVIPAAMGLFGKRPAAIAKGAMLGGGAGVLAAGMLARKKKKPTAPANQVLTSPGTVGPSPSYGSI